MLVVYVRLTISANQSHITFSLHHKGITIFLLFYDVHIDFMLLFHRQ